MTQAARRRPGPSKADAQRQRLVSEAAAIFSRQGFRATSMNEIAAAVGMSKPALYYYFRNKEELLVRIYSDVLDESLAMARETVADATSSFDAVRDLIASRVVYTCRNQALLKVCFEEEHELPADLASEILQRRRTFEALFADELRGHLERHPDLDLGMSPSIYVNMCLGAVNWCYKWFDPAGPSSPEEIGRQMAAALTVSLATR
ncbi:Transcriptional regulator, TetR family [Pseudonocardia sp. Ae168_Ps1]|uniref:TetR/AcrR family transcriptional regulator n=1 Tax=unclassified Pseudonocardia TaxID=2619320 RepID=UPI00094B5FDD|nr:MULTISPECIES: TetR/AcrR family transcriptional regulator [unclassified Pseudonocardia]OLL75913.1 Transcriptional regulator, TetR family [Pseudonocardia sp. Ae150A_Ps1]OLL81912.1 Transcriptional regulator, TetR family [Pseudonocardia sp. Ae168_Ps1]OLL83975.1 Transcriptional regulator, TetR family [Pseudonocardia sp. Ae263_Ps1]OLL96005.1 Transcriptional regulator, TetR family [Pseudonocardia sp. Ae356_Ps1]